MRRAAAALEADDHLVHVRELELLQLRHAEDAGVEVDRPLQVADADADGADVGLLRGGSVHASVVGVGWGTGGRHGGLLGSGGPVSCPSPSARRRRQGTAAVHRDALGAPPGDPTVEPRASTLVSDGASGLAYDGRPSDDRGRRRGLRGHPRRSGVPGRGPGVPRGARLAPHRAPTPTGRGATCPRTRRGRAST